MVMEAVIRWGCMQASDDIIQKLQLKSSYFLKLVHDKVFVKLIKWLFKWEIILLLYAPNLQ